MFVVGIDLSLNHSGIIRLKDGELDDYFFLTTKLASHKKAPDNSHRIVLPKNKDKQIQQMDRLAQIIQFFMGSVFNQRHDHDAGFVCRSIHPIRLRGRGQEQTHQVHAPALIVAQNAVKLTHGIHHFRF